MLLPLSRLTLDHALQARAGGLNPDHVQRLREALRDGATLPAVVAYADDEIGRLWLADGWHRVAAHRDEGREELDVETRPGGRAAALVHALGANAHHGLPRTREDKRRAVDLALYDAGLSALPDREIARITATSHTFVATRRGLIQAEAQGREAAPRSRAEGLAKAQAHLIGGLEWLLDHGVVALALPTGDRRIADLIPEVTTWDRAAVDLVQGVASEVASAHGRAAARRAAAESRAEEPAAPPQPPAAERRADSRARGERIGRCIAALRLRSEPLYLPDLGGAPLGERDVRALADEQLDRLESILFPPGPSLAQLRDQTEAALTTLIRLGIGAFDLPDQPGQEIGLWLDGLEESTADELAAALPVLQEQIEQARAAHQGRVLAEEAERPGASVYRVVEVPATDDEDAMLGEALDEARQERDAARAELVAIRTRLGLADEASILDALALLQVRASVDTVTLQHRLDAAVGEAYARQAERDAAQRKLDELTAILDYAEDLGNQPEVLSALGRRLLAVIRVRDVAVAHATRPVETLPEGWPDGEWTRRNPRDVRWTRPGIGGIEVDGDYVSADCYRADDDEIAEEYARQLAWAIARLPTTLKKPDPLALYRPWTRSADELAAHLEALEQGERYDLAQTFGVSLGGRLIERLTMSIMRPGRVAA